MIGYNKLALELPTQLCAKNFLVLKRRLMLKSRTEFVPDNHRLPWIHRSLLSSADLVELKMASVDRKFMFVDYKKNTGIVSNI